MGGYSFVEGIFATFIVTVGIVAVIQLMSASLTSLINSRNQTMATFLTQEGIEVVRNIRDNNWASGKNTFDSSTFPNVSKDNCKIDLYSTAISSCDNSSAHEILQKNSSNIYLYDGGSPNSQFRRRIKITYYDVNGNSSNASNAYYATINSEVTWNGKDYPSSINDCNSLHYCAFTEVTLNKWGGSD